MTSEVAYRVVGTATRGKIVVATRDILPGEIVVNDTEPILTFTAEFLKVYEACAPHEVALALAAYNTYLNVLTPEKKARFASLFGPTTGGFVETLRAFVAKINPVKLTAEETDLFIRVANVVRLNAFGDEGVCWSVFGEATRLSHSCAANCRFTLEGPSCICTALQPIRQGEELTISYMLSRDLQPIHERRLRYLERKEFTCHCPRCDALGDDTRQFDCFDPACKGVMMVCQPLSREDIHVPGLSYSGVEYVEPHLLPCTVCRRTPPYSHVRDLLALESTFESLAWSISERFEVLMERRAYGDMDLMLREIRKFPSHHVACWPILLVKLKIIDKLSTYRGSVTRAHLAAALVEYVTVQEDVFPHPTEIVCQNLLSVCIMFCSAYTLRPVLSPEQEKELWQKGLRMYLILHGREKRERNTDTLLAGVLGKLPPLRSTELCGFCEESPHRAAMKRMRCGTCRYVMYCSLGCQRAHWKVHRKVCMTATAELW